MDGESSGLGSVVGRCLLSMGIAVRRATAERQVWKPGSARREWLAFDGFRRQGPLEAGAGATAVVREVTERMLPAVGSARMPEPSAAIPQVVLHGDRLEVGWVPRRVGLDLFRELVGTDGDVLRFGLSRDEFVRGVAGSRAFAMVEAGEAAVVLARLLDEAEDALEEASVEAADLTPWF